MVAAQYDVPDLETALCELLGVDSVTYLEEEGLAEVEGEQICSACFNGDYVVPVSDSERADIISDRRPD